MAHEREMMSDTGLSGHTAGGDMGVPTRGAFSRFLPVGAILTAEVILILIAALPGVADFKKFGFYDEGAWLHMDALYAAGKVPTVDFGYSYGMLPLLLGHAWFSIFGRTPWAFVAFVTLCNLITAWGVASILAVIVPPGAGERRTWPWLPIALTCLLLPYAIFPSNYSLMHPLEMMLIVLALALQIRGRYGAALAFATLAVLTKPTMGYVLGLLLLLFAWRMRKGWRVVIPPVIAGICGCLLELCTLGWAPLKNNLLPLTGGKSYRAMNFGFFHAGRDFWWHFAGSPLGTLEYYLNTPVLMFFAGTLLTWVAAGPALARIAKRRIATPLNDADPSAPDLDATLITIAILHAVFIFALYAWSGSWTYYSYLWIIGLLIVILRPRSKVDFAGGAARWLTTPRARIAAVAVFAALGLWAKCAQYMGQWTGMERKGDTAGLWTYPEFWNDAEEVREMARGRHALYLVNGNLPAFWPEAQIPAVWFLSPDIQTPAEIAAIEKQIAAADMVILLREYDPRQEAWNWPEFKEQRDEFALARDGQFQIWRRRMPP